VRTTATQRLYLLAPYAPTIRRTIRMETGKKVEFFKTVSQARTHTVIVAILMGSGKSLWKPASEYLESRYMNPTMII